MKYLFFEYIKMNWLPEQKSISVYEIRDWKVQVQYWIDMDEIKNAKRWLHTQVGIEDYNIIVNWTVERVEWLCRKLLSKYD